ncbi:MAG: hypothetical protein AAFX98_08135, partial [Pseudomonadota bacterium]
MKTKAKCSIIAAGLALPLSIALMSTLDPSNPLHCVPESKPAVELQARACAHESEVRYKSMFGRRFLHLGDVFSRLELKHDQKELGHSYSVAGHFPSFEIGDTISILHAPNGDRFIGVNSLVASNSESVVLPFGWTLKTHELSNSIETELIRQMLAFYFDDMATEQELIT